MKRTLPQIIDLETGETMKREVRQIIDLDSGEDGDHDFRSQVAAAEARASAKRVRPTVAATATVREVKPQVKEAYLAPLRGDGTPGLWPKQQSKLVGAGSRVKVAAADGANVSRGGSGKCGKFGGGTQLSEPEKVCPCGLGGCLVLTSNTVKNRGRRFYKCPVKEENGGCGFFEWCDNASGAAYIPNMSSDGRNSSQFPDLLCPCGAGSCLILTAKKGNNVGQQFYKCPANQLSSCHYFKWCNDHTAVASLPASPVKVHDSFNYEGSKSYGTTSVSSCFNCGKEGHWAKDCSLHAPDYSSASSAGKVYDSFNYWGSKSYNTASGSSYFKGGKDGHWAKDYSLPAPDYSSTSSARKDYNSFNYRGSKSYADYSFASSAREDYNSFNYRGSKSYADYSSASSAREDYNSFNYRGSKSYADYSYADYSSASSARKDYNNFNYRSSKSYGTTSGSSYSLLAPNYSASSETGKSSSPGKAGYSAKDCFPSNAIVKWERQ